MLNATRKAARPDKALIDTLRVAAYEKATEFVVEKPEKLLWNPEDGLHTVLAVFASPESALATMQGTVVTSIANMRSYMEAELPNVELDFPCLILTSAATIPGRHRRGLNSLLRYFFFRAAADSNIRSIAGQVFDNAPRVKLMAELGYSFYPIEHVSYDELSPTTKLSLALLRSSQLDTALTSLDSMTSAARHTYPWSGPALTLKAP